MADHERLPDPEYLREILLATPDGLVWADSGKPAGRGGLISIRGRKYRSDRVAWAIANRRDPGNADVVHFDGRQDNNDPANLELGRARQPRGRAASSETPKASRYRKLPDPKYLRAILRATPDGLVWADERPANHFRTMRGWSVWRSRCAGKPTGRTVGPNGKLLVSVDGISYSSARIAWAIANGRDPGRSEVIHMDGDKTNLDPSNLDLTQGGERWEYWREKGMWRGGFEHNGRMMQTRRQKTPEAAHAAVIEARKALGLPV